MRNIRCKLNNNFVYVTFDLGTIKFYFSSPINIYKVLVPHLEALNPKIDIAFIFEQMETESKKTFSLEIDNFSERNEVIKSDPFSSGGCEW